VVVHHHPNQPLLLANLLVVNQGGLPSNAPITEQVSGLQERSVKADMSKVLVVYSALPSTQATARWLSNTLMPLVVVLVITVEY
jgi:hypothetical protein